MTWDPETSRGNESEKVLWDIVAYTRGKGLDIGCGPWKAYDHFIGFDREGADETGDAQDLSRYEDGVMDFIYSSHCLEDLEQPEQALSEWSRVVKREGYLVLYLPDEETYPRVGEFGANINHKFNVNYDIIIGMMESVERDWDLIRFEKRDQGDEYSLFFVFLIQ